MNWYTILQSVLVYGLTTFAVAVATWCAKTSKRITILEEHEKSMDVLVSSQRLAEQKIDEVVAKQIEITTKLDLLLSGKLSVSNSRRRAKSDKAD